MAATQELTLEIATPAGLVLQTTVKSVQAPSVEGEFGVLPMHLPLLAALKAGVVLYEIDHKKHVAAIGRGFAEAGPGKVLILTDMFLKPEQIDLDAAVKDQASAEAALRAFGERHEGPEFHELERNLNWAIARQNAYRLWREIV